MTARDEQPAPAGADELRDEPAEDLQAFDDTRKWARQWIRRYVEVHPDTADAVWGELIERGRERDAARAEVQQARELKRKLWQAAGRPDGVGLDAELVDAVADWRQSSLDRGAEVERLREENQRLRQVEASARQLHMWRAEVTRLRARDEAAKAVVRAWRANEAAPFEGTTPALFELLDALARAHEDEGTS